MLISKEEWEKFDAKVSKIEKIVSDINNNNSSIREAMNFIEYSGIEQFKREEMTNLAYAVASSNVDRKFKDKYSSFANSELFKNWLTTKEFFRDLMSSYLYLNFDPEYVEDEKIRSEIEKHRNAIINNFMSTTYPLAEIKSQRLSLRQPTKKIMLQVSPDNKSLDLVPEDDIFQYRRMIGSKLCYLSSKYILDGEKKSIYALEETMNHLPINQKADGIIGTALHASYRISLGLDHSFDNLLSFFIANKLSQDRLEKKFIPERILDGCSSWLIHESEKSGLDLYRERVLEYLESMNKFRDLKKKWLFFRMLDHVSPLEDVSLKCVDALSIAKLIYEKSPYLARGDAYEDTYAPVEIQMMTEEDMRNKYAEPKFECEGYD